MHILRADASDPLYAQDIDSVRVILRSPAKAIAYAVGFYCRKVYTAIYDVLRDTRNVSLTKLPTF